MACFHVAAKTEIFLSLAGRNIVLDVNENGKLVQPRGVGVPLFICTARAKDTILFVVGRAHNARRTHTRHLYLKGLSRLHRLLQRAYVNLREENHAFLFR